MLNSKTWKRILALGISAVMMLSLVACGGQTDDEDDESDDNNKAYTKALNYKFSENWG